MVQTAQNWPAPPAPPPPTPGGPGDGRRRTVLAALAAILAILVGSAIGLAVGLASRHAVPAPAAAAPSSGAAGGSATAARQLYSELMQAAAASAGCHYVAVTSGGVSQRFVGDAGRSSGTQVITMSSSYGAEQFTLVLANGIVYFSGNAASLQDQLGVPAAKAPSIAGTWISVTSADGPFGILDPGITVSSQLLETMLNPTSIQAREGGITRVVGTVPALAGAHATGYLDVASASKLPASYVVTVTGRTATTTSTTTFSGWGTPPAVTPAPSAQAWSTLGASIPPGGYGQGGASSSQTPAA